MGVLESAGAGGDIAAQQHMRHPAVRPAAHCAHPAAQADSYVYMHMLGGPLLCMDPAGAGPGRPYASKSMHVMGTGSCVAEHEMCSRESLPLVLHRRMNPIGGEGDA
jgi:hypothetical protein